MTENQPAVENLPIAAVVRALNKAFQENWSFDIVGHELLGERVEVTGELRANGTSAREKGRAERNGVLRGRSIGELLEAASDDSLRRCALLLLNGRGLPEPVPVEKARGPVPEVGPFRIGQGVVLRELAELLRVLVMLSMGENVPAVGEWVQAKGDEGDNVQPVFPQLQVVDHPALKNVQNVGAEGDGETAGEFFANDGASHPLQAL